MPDLLSPHSLLFAVAGVAALGGAALPRLIGRAPLSPPMVFLALGFVVFSRPPVLTRWTPRSAASSPSTSPRSGSSSA